jgi:ParB family chromosome partitioning protein
MKNRKYSIPSALNADISNTVELTKNNICSMNYRLVPLGSIEADPNNPRELAISVDDLPDGPKHSDPLYSQKTKEFESLKLFAKSIEEHGIRIPIEIYKYGVGYRLVHGERRYLGALIANKKVIPAKVLDEKPTEFDLMELQLIENVQRENLSLYETLRNIEMVINAYKEHIDQDVKIDAPFLHKIIYKSIPQCYNYLTILNASGEIWDEIKKGQIRSLEKAVLIENEKNTEAKRHLLNLCINGSSLKELRKVAKNQDINSRHINNRVTSRRPGKAPSKINLGNTTNKFVVRKIINIVSEDICYTQFSSIFNNMNFEDFSSCTNAFEALIKLMEKIES